MIVLWVDAGGDHAQRVGVSVGDSAAGMGGVRRRRPAPRQRHADVSSFLQETRRNWIGQRSGTRRGVEGQGREALTRLRLGGFLSLPSLSPPSEGPVDKAPSWAELEGRLEALLTEEERRMIALREEGSGPPSCFAPVRLFRDHQCEGGEEGAGEETETVRVRLFRDTAAWCPYCEKVWLTLEEKRVPYSVELVNMTCYGDKRKDYLDLVQSGLLPAVEIDGRIHTESLSIVNLLERSFTSPEFVSLIPSNISDDELKTIPKLVLLERRLFGAWLDWIVTPLPGILQGGNREKFREKMTEVDAELKKRGGPFFLGDDEKFSLVDILFAPTLERIAASCAYFKGEIIRGGAWPSVDLWFDAMERRPTYKAIRSDFYTTVQALPPQLPFCSEMASETQKACKSEIDGQNGGWVHPPRSHPGRLILEPSVSLERKEDKEETAAAMKEAARNLVRNRHKVLPFTLRAFSALPALPPVSAPLSEPGKPTDTPETSLWTPHVDCALRHVAALLLDVAAAGGGRAEPWRQNFEDPKDPGREAETGKEGMPGPSLSPQLDPRTVAALRYLQVRVGAPRDMSAPAALQLRRFLGLVITCLTSR
uniref:GST N-terminal domain-containing protein n=1 Tax=Chromera velia CCMP2878 TaxID=1169474 RepID=A0A0G4IEQ4_9ALVE|eukprot:Cvel_13724.t1-p1 / transcript=Cvel_13724.t1 / gene=Cvel_13724 / organism=Chromera_velia_CCMP2878 / gene_product=Glutathione S-transferase DHAR2, putative / transcript_product=Glutathione S-transferase DHAR2, putative / location=Cvel_scaffold949:20108-24127(-) / protein_length=593 / sequence_SO=supercontig / SO=protein_coding / is_pseudo=false